MPINEKMMLELKVKHGDKKGEDMYYAIEAKRKKSKGALMPDMNAKPVWGADKHTKRRI